MFNGQNFPRHYLLLWLIVVISLVVNVALFVQLGRLRNRAVQEIDNATATLKAIDVDNYEMPIHVDETLPISMTVPFSDTFAVPISTTVPVSDAVHFQDTLVVPINTVIPVNTTVSVPIPALNNRRISIPIVAEIPVNMSVDVPVNHTIPVQLDIPVNLMVEVPVQSEVPIQTDVPVKMDFPVTLPLNDLLLQVQDVLDGLRRALEG